jgi:hypothetical protein
MRPELSVYATSQQCAGAQPTFDAVCCSSHQPSENTTTVASAWRVVAAVAARRLGCPASCGAALQAKSLAGGGARAGRDRGGADTAVLCADSCSRARMLAVLSDYSASVNRTSLAECQVTGGLGGSEDPPTSILYLYRIN